MPGSRAPEIRNTGLAMGWNAALLDWDAEFQFDYCYTEPFFSRFLERMPSRQTRGSLRENPLDAGGRSVFTEKDMAACTLDDVAGACFHNLGNHLYFMDCVRDAWGLDSPLGAGALAMFRDFADRALSDPGLKKLPVVAALLLQDPAQIFPAEALAALIRQSHPQTRTVLIDGIPERVRPPGFAPPRIGSAYDAVCGADRLEELSEFIRRSPVASGRRTRARDAVPSPTGTGALPLDYNDLPLHLYPVRMFRPLCGGEAGGLDDPHAGAGAPAVAGEMQRLFVETGYDAFVLGDIGRVFSGVLPLAEHILETGFRTQWSAHLAPWSGLTRTACRTLRASGLSCAFLELDVPGPQLRDRAALFVENALELAENDIAVNAVLAVRRETSSGEIEACMARIAPVLPRLNGLVFHVDGAPVPGVRGGPPASRPDLSGAVGAFRAACPRPAPAWPDLLLECSLRDSPFRARAARPFVGLAYLCCDQETPEEAAPLSLLCLEQYARLDPVTAASVRIGRLCLSQAVADEDLLRDLLRENPALIGFSCYVWNIERVMALSRKIRGAAPGVRIVLGGPAVADPALVFRACGEAVDFVVTGEGEIPFEALLRALFSDRGGPVESIPGLAFLRHGELVRTTPDKVFTPVASLPSVYTPDILRDMPATATIYLDTTRGCPGACRYCLWSRRLKVFSLLRVGNELRSILRSRHWRGAYLVINDSVFNRNLARMKAVLKLMIRHNTRGCRFLAALGPDRLDAGSARLLRRAGFQFLYVGLESIHEHTLEAAGRKPMDFAAAGRMMELLKKHGLFPVMQCGVLLGLPGDDYGKFRQTLQWCFQNNVAIHVFHLLVFPGTAFRTDAARWGLQFEERAPYALTASGTFPRPDLERAARLAVNYLTVRTLLQPGPVAFLQARGVDLVGIAEGLALDEAFYSRDVLKRYDVTEDVLMARTPCDPFPALREAFRDRIADAGVRRLLCAAVSCREAELRLRRCLRDRKPGGPGPARPGQALVSAGCVRLDLPPGLAPVLSESPGAHKAPCFAAGENFVALDCVQERLHRIPAGAETRILELTAEGQGAQAQALEQILNREFPAMKPGRIRTLIERMKKQGFVWEA